jgi:hypothetical protein
MAKAKSMTKAKARVVRAALGGPSFVGAARPVAPLYRPRPYVPPKAKRGKR